MIRAADSEALGALLPNSEAMLRILGAAAAYGIERPFCRFWTDDHGGALMIAEGVATLHAPSFAEDWLTFLTMSPDVYRVRTDAATAQALALLWNTEATCGQVMRAQTITPCGDAVVSAPSQLYPLISAVFGEAVPPFDGWYADVHHRLRRERFHACAVCEGGEVLSCAMTVAECDAAVLLGAVATHPAARGRGLASACVTQLAHICRQSGKDVYISPKNAAAAELYSRLGFMVCGDWGQVQRGKE
ncbi:MAG: GNAT family N-acetyltransferase [Ruminococcaceae bacterium]|nr:GNAT family N-acetyltransferase [Oscillospiraceae bacterium]